MYSNEISFIIKINNETIAINTQEDTLAILKAKYDDDNKTYYIETDEEEEEEQEEEEEKVELRQRRYIAEPDYNSSNDSDSD